MVLHYSSGSPFEKAIGYSRAVVDGNMVYISGTTGYDYAAMTLPADAATQARNALSTIARVLDEAGGSLHDVVRVHYYIADRADWPAIMPVLGETFGQIRPAATLLITGLMEPEMKIEIEVTARLGAGGR
jgi:enamine deaminase RidA (YjgF/YER057c/UK114 family)